MQLVMWYEPRVVVELLNRKIFMGTNVYLSNVEEVFSNIFHNYQSVVHAIKTPEISNSTIVQIVRCLVICIRIDALICNLSDDLRLIMHIKAIGFSTS